MKGATACPIGAAKISANTLCREPLTRVGHRIGWLPITYWRALMRLRGLACAVLVCGTAAWAETEPTEAFDFWLSRAATNDSVPKELVPSDAYSSQAHQSPVPVGSRNLVVANNAGQGVAKDESATTFLKQACSDGDQRACRAVERSRILTNESAVLGRLVAYISAQAAYLSANRGTTRRASSASSPLRPRAVSDPPDRAHRSYLPTRFRTSRRSATDSISKRCPRHATPSSWAQAISRPLPSWCGRYRSKSGEPAAAAS